MMELQLQSILFFVLGVGLASWPRIKDILPRLLSPKPPLFTGNDDAPSAPESLISFTSLAQEPGIHQICTGVYQARGFALGNSIMIEGRDGIVIVDTTESLVAAREIMAEFRKITDKPVAAIVYTHFHVDHITGTAAFVEDPANPPPIYSHADTARQISRFLSTPDLSMKRAYRQFGVFIPPKWKKSSRIGSFLRLDIGGGRKGAMSPMLPSVTFENELEATLAGDLRIRMIHSPGETDDQIILWLPERKVLLPADNLYKAFPNLYAIRGNPARDPKKWIASVDLMRSLKPDYLVPSHFKAIVGAEEIERILRDYRDGMQFVLDQTLRLMNKGIHPDDLQYMIQLPSKLRENPYLFEHYGTLKWSSRGIFNLYMGWFSGYAEDLMPLPRQLKASHYIKLMGGVASVLDAAEAAMSRAEASNKDLGQDSAFDTQLALELSSMILACEDSSGPLVADAKAVRVAALKGLGAQQTSIAGRNYYLTQALETNGMQIQGNRADGIRSAPMKSLFSLMPNRVDPKKAEGVEGSLMFHFTDTQEKYLLTIRSSIVLQQMVEDTTPIPSNAVTLKIAEALWREILIGEKSGATAMAQGLMAIEGGSVAQVASMLGIFEG